MQWFSTILQTMAKPLKWWVVVASWEQGIRVRLGKVTKRLDPGIHFRLPFLDRIYVQSTRLRVLDAQGQSISTLKGDIITFGLVVRYQIQDIVKMYQTTANAGTVLLCDAVSKTSHLIATAESDPSPAFVEEKVNAAMPSHEYGLGKVQVSIVNFCRTRCYRMITGNGWIGTDNSLDDARSTGEVK